MASDLVYDPNDPDAFVAAWLEEVASEYTDHKYNGFVLLDDDRNVLDMFVNDVDDEFLNEEDEGRNGYDVLEERIKDVGATNVIGMHGHRATDSPGPCPSLPQFAGDCLIEVKRRTGADFRMTMVIRGIQLDGILATEIPDFMAEALATDDNDIIEQALARAEAAQPFMDMPAPELDGLTPRLSAQELLDSHRFDDDPNVMRALRQMAKGEEPDIDTLMAAIKSTIDKMEGNITKGRSLMAGYEPEEEDIDPFSLPILRLPKGDLLN